MRSVNNLHFIWLLIGFFPAVLIAFTPTIVFTIVGILIVGNDGELVALVTIISAALDIFLSTQTEIGKKFFKFRYDLLRKLKWDFTE